MITLIQGDITSLDCDCIVNAANEGLIAGGGVCGAIHRAAGPLLQKECDEIAPCPTGSAKITKGYNLTAKWVIHAVGPVYSTTEDVASLLRSCYVSSLELAREYGIRNIAFPAISTGIFGYPLREATEIAVATVKEWQRQNADYELEVIFCCYDLGTHFMYDVLLKD